MTEQELKQERELQEKAERLVREHVHCNASTLIQALGLMAEGYRDGCQLAEQIIDLSTEQDWETPARDEGWQPAEDENDENDPQNFIRNLGPMDASDNDRFEEVAADGWEGLCRDQNLNPQEREVFEYWIVSDWLARQLKKQGCRVDYDVLGLIVWGRTTTGQSISMDGVIRAIAKGH